MKKQLWGLLAAFIVLVATSVQSVSAQQNAAVGSNFTYTYTQTVSGSAIGWSVTGPAAVTTSSTAVTQAITWPTTTGTYTITVTETNGTSCAATTNYTVVVGSRTISFASTSASAICSSVGTDYTTTVNFSVAITASELPATVPVNISGTNGTASATSVSATLSGLAGDGLSATLTIPHGTYDFEANTNSASPKLNQAKTITLTATTDAKGGTLSLGTNTAHAITINALPTTSTITHN